MTLPELPHASFLPQEPPDHAVRRAALNPDSSFAVAAPAGSGKTGLLTQRLLTLLARCDAPEEILAITFTRKAAGEMQDRILQALWQAQQQPEPENPHARFTWQLARAVLERDQALGWQLLFSPQRLRVQTIDSLCRSLTRQMPLGSGLGAQPDTLQDTEPAYRQAVRQSLTLLEQDSPWRDGLARLLRHLDNNLDTVERLLMALLARREQWLGHLLQSRQEQAREWLEHNLQRVIEDHLQTLRHELAIFTAELCGIADRAARYLQDEEGERKNRIHELLGIAALPATNYHALPQWQALSDLLLTNSGGWRARLTKAEGFPAGKNPEHVAHKDAMSSLLAALDERGPECLQKVRDLRSLPSPHYNDDQWQLLDSLTRLLPLLVAQLNLVFQQLGATDYTAITQAALQALGDDDNPSDLALQLDYRIRHILVDEFQDTSGPQLQLLQKLTAGWQPGDGRTLFIVGDGMQSCYGFRDANVGLFLDARRQGIAEVPLEALDLQVNFRSQTGIVNWVNRTFHQAFPAQDDIARGAVHYSPSIAVKPPLPQAAVQTFVCSYTTEAQEDIDDDEDTSAGKQAASLCEADAVLALIQQAKAEDPQGTIAVLVRNRTHLRDLLARLSAAGLSWQATDIDSLASRMAITDLHSLTRALLNPNDRIAWLALLRAPWCGLSLHDLHALATTHLPEHTADGNYPPLWPQVQAHQGITTLSTTGHKLLERLRLPLQQALAEQQRKPLRQWVEGVWLALGGPASLLDPSDRDNVQSYFALLDAHQEAGGIRDWAAFDRALQQLYAKPRADADPQLQVMTIHKSKGLEFDTVIMPGLDRRPRNDDSQLLLWQERLNQEGDRQLLLGPLSATGDDKSPIYHFLQQESSKRQRYEATRLLYVGCTRAIKRLYLLACLKRKNDELQPPVADSLLFSIWPCVKDQVQPPPVSQQPFITPVQTRPLPATPLLRLPPNWQPPVPADTSPLARYRGHEYDDDDNQPEAETRQNRLARHTGTLLHRALQTLCEQGLAQTLQAETRDAYLARQTPFWQLQLQQHGWQGEEQQHALTKIQRAITRMLKDEKGQWLLDNRHAHSACELSLYQQRKDSLRQLIIDRTFVDQGIRWIVDYKSSEPQPGQLPVAFVEAEVAQYRAQLAGYREAFNQLGQERVCTALYFPLLETGNWVEVLLE